MFTNLTFFALLNELENQYLHERKKTSNSFTTTVFDMKSLKTLWMISGTQLHQVFYILNFFFCK